MPADSGIIAGMKRALLLLALGGWLAVSGSWFPLQRVRAQAGSPQALIDLVNQVRVANGLPALIVDPILMATAQATAETMAANGTCAHIGNVSGRVAAAGYGGGATVFATENISCGYNRTVEQVVYQDWADAQHMLPMTDPNYVHVGAGVVEAEGRVYYVLHAAYFSGVSAGYTPRPSSANSNLATPMPIFPVQTVTPNPDGSLVHKVQPGQALWSIAIAYGVKIADLIALNRLAPTPVLFPGQELIIRPSFTPTESPTVTPTLPPPTRTPTLTPTPRTPTPIPTATLTPTATPRPFLPAVFLADPENRRALGMGLLIISALGLLIVIGSSLRGKSGS